MLKIRKSKQQCFPLNPSFKAGNGKEYREVVIPLSSPNKQGNMAVIQTVRIDNLEKED
jgi:hypothetical protein